MQILKVQSSSYATCEKIVKYQNVSDETLVARYDAKESVMKQWEIPVRIKIHSLAHLAYLFSIALKELVLDIFGEKDREILDSRILLDVCLPSLL